MAAPPAALPTGTVTFLFTDIEGSTRLWDEHPAQMTEAVATHDQILRRAVEAHKGYVFSTAGDSFAAAFHAPDDAVDAAIAAQLELNEHHWPVETPIRVRMALHSGTAHERDGDYFGPVPNRCARLLAVANGGQVLMTAVTHGMVRQSAGTGLIS
ncbi:MAG: adenylate/guanylate cyclase domain-containing protein [Acidimicrobiia bacterium]